MSDNAYSAIAKLAKADYIVQVQHYDGMYELNVWPRGDRAAHRHFEGHYLSEAVAKAYAAILTGRE